MTLPDDLRRQMHRDDGASLQTLSLLEAAADEIDRLRASAALEAPVWSATEMADLLQAMARSADRHTLSFSECASIARSAADVIRYLQAELDRR
jgi:hypothetical protein